MTDKIVTTKVRCQTCSFEKMLKGAPTHETWAEIFHHDDSHLHHVEIEQLIIRRMTYRPIDRNDL